MPRRLALCFVLLLGVLPGASRADGPKVGQRLERLGDEIVVCGQLFHTTTRVVLWNDPGGYDAYRVERRFGPPPERGASGTSKAQDSLSPNRYGDRRRVLTPEQREQVRIKGWDLPTLQSVVDQFVIHFDARGTSRECFRILHDVRGLSVQFMLDLDGTIYQTLDAKEGAWHATIANSRSIGIEIANIGAYPTDASDPLDRWYEREPTGRVRLVAPKGEVLPDSGRILRPTREELITGTIQGKSLRQYDYTPEQYDALIKLTATLCTIFPKITCDYPRDASGHLIPHKLPDDQLRQYHGILGHYHVQTNKVDPGPAFQWDRVIEGARRLIPK